MRKGMKQEVQKRTNKGMMGKGTELIRGTGRYSRMRKGERRKS